MLKNNDQVIRTLQIARDKEDTAYWSKVWWGRAASDLKRRAESLDECKLVVCSRSGKYATLQFRVLDGKQTIYGAQSFYLRNQWEWDRNKPPDQSYWYDDPGDWMSGIFNNDDFQALLDEDGEHYKNATDEQRKFDCDNVGQIRTFTQAEKDIVGECVLPTVRRIDEIWSSEGKSAQDYGYKLRKRIYTAKREKEDDSYDDTWETEISGVDKTLKLRMFKALQLLSIHAF